MFTPKVEKKSPQKLKKTHPKSWKKVTPKVAKNVPPKVHKLCPKWPRILDQMGRHFWHQMVPIFGTKRLQNWSGTTALKILCGKKCGFNFGSRWSHGEKERNCALKTTSFGMLLVPFWWPFFIRKFHLQLFEILKYLRENSGIERPLEKETVDTFFGMFCA
jgi:hypothetical protein